MEGEVDEADHGVNRLTALAREFWDMESQLYSVVLPLLSLSSLMLSAHGAFPLQRKHRLLPLLTHSVSFGMNERFSNEITIHSCVFCLPRLSPFPVQNGEEEPYLSGLIRVLNHLIRELRSTSGPPVPVLTSSPKSRLISRHKNHIKFLRLDSKVHYK